MAFTFTRLNTIKPEMVAEATRDARASAEQFAKDSGAGVGSIKQATQGYFTIESRDGETGAWASATRPTRRCAWSLRSISRLNRETGASAAMAPAPDLAGALDRKSTRLNSSH